MCVCICFLNTNVVRQAATRQFHKANHELSEACWHIAQIEHELFLLLRQPDTILSSCPGSQKHCPARWFSTTPQNLCRIFFPCVSNARCESETPLWQARWCSV